MPHQMLSDLDVRVKLNKQEGERLVDYGRELVPVNAEMLQELEHQLEGYGPQQPLAVAAPAFQDS